MDSIRKLKIETDKLKLMHKLRIEEQVNLQKSVLKMLNQQIEQQRQVQKTEMQQKITRRIEENKQHQQLRQRMKARSNKEIEKLKILKEIHDIENEERVKFINLQKNIEEQRILEQKKKILSPIKFEQINQHEQRYLEKKKSEKKSTFRSLPKLTGYRPIYTTKASEIVRKEFIEAKHSHQFKKMQSHQQNAKRVAYGIEAQKKHLHDKIKTEPSKYDVMDQQLNRERVLNMQKQLKKVRKEKIRFVQGDVVQFTKKQIDGIKESGLSFQEKFDILNNLSKGYIEKFDNGKDYCVQLAASANIALAELYLSQQSN